MILQKSITKIELGEYRDLLRCLRRLNPHRSYEYASGFHSLAPRISSIFTKLKIASLSAIFFCLAVVSIFPTSARASSDFATPDWEVSYKINGTSIVMDNEFSVPLGEVAETVYGWPSAPTGSGTVYGDIYKGEINAAEFVSGHELVGGIGVATTSDTFLAPGRYFIAVYEFNAGDCTGSDFCVPATPADARWWFTQYRADFESCAVNFTDPEQARNECLLPLSLFGIVHFGYIPFSVVDGVIVPPPPPPPALPDAFSNVAFLPGLEASRLYVHDATGEKRLWEPRLNGDVGRLFLNADGASIESGIYTRDIIDESDSLPLTPRPFFGFNIYKNFIEFMNGLVASSTIREWRAFPYDWRMGLDDIAVRGAPVSDGSFFDIVSGIEYLAATSATGKVTIIGHSNGGLLGKLIIDELAARGEGNLVDKLILVATPQVGTPKALTGLLHGDGLNMPDGFEFLLSKQTARELSTNMPSAYTLLPSDAYVGRVVDPVIEFDPLAHVLDSFRGLYGLAINTAAELQSFLRGDNGVRARPQAVFTDVPNVANGALYDHARTLQNRLDTWTAPVGVEVFQIAGWGLGTLRGTYYTERKVMKCNENLSVCLPVGVLDREPLVTRDGDETVVTASAAYMDSIETFYLDLGTHNRFIEGNRNREHADILEVKSAQKLISNVISGVDTLLQYVSTEKPSSSKSLRIRVHSPVSLDVYDSRGFHTGIATSSTSDLEAIDEQIPNSSYMEFGEGKYIGLDGDDAYTILLHGLDTGTFTLGIDTIEDDVVTGSVAYENIPVTASTTAQILVQSTGSTTSLTLDTDGNGTMDTTLTSARIDPRAYVELMESVLERMNISKSTKKKIEKALDEIEDALGSKYRERNVKKIIKKIDELKETVQKFGKKKGSISIADAETLMQMIEQLNLLVLQ